MKRSAIIFGKPGRTWRNLTPHVRYQFFCSWQNTCGACAQYDSAIGPIWPIPLHMGCRCYQRAVVPGSEATPFTDFRETARQLEAVQLQALVGRSSWTLIERGAVSWEDVVTPSRVRRFREVVARAKLTREALKRLGIRSSVADAAIATVDTAPARIAAAERQALVEMIAEAGKPHKALVEEVAEKLAEQVMVGPRPAESRREDRIGPVDLNTAFEVAAKLKAGGSLPASGSAAVALGRVLATALAAQEIRRRAEESGEER